MSTDLVPNGNICLTFENSISQQLTQFAAQYFSGIADGYLLGPDSIAHITLCQIHHDKPQPRALRRDLGNVAVIPEAISLQTLTQRVGGNTHSGYTWLAFNLAPTAQWIGALKNDVENILRTYDIPSLTPPMPDYHPHLTLCRFKTANDAINAAPKDFAITIDPTQLELSLGLSDAQGQFKKIYWKRPLA